MVTPLNNRQPDRLNNDRGGSPKDAGPSARGVSRHRDRDGVLSCQHDTCQRSRNRAKCHIQSEI